MSEVKTYAVNCNDAWLNTDGDDISGSYVKYSDYRDIATKLDIAERACAAMAAESAALKDINAWCKTDAFKNMYREFKTAEAVGCCNIDCMHDAMVVAIMHAPEAPATDAFLDEIRAQGVDMFAQWCRGERDFTLIDEDVADAAAYEECVKRAEYFSAQIRKGGDQK